MTRAELEAAAEFYENSPDGQYDELAAEIIRRYIWLREHGARDTESHLNSLTPEQYDADLTKAME